MPYRVKHQSCCPVPCSRLLVDCNQLAVDIDNEIVVVYNFLRDRYKTKFPELESLVHNPLDYARVVQVGRGRGGGGLAEAAAGLEHPARTCGH
jgi:hypothetical protein